MSPEDEQGVNTAQSSESRAAPETSNAPSQGTEEVKEQGTEEATENIESLGLPEDESSTSGRVGDILKKPPVGAGIAGGIVLGAASVFGALEAAIAAGAAYAAYRILRKKQPPSES